MREGVRVMLEGSEGCFSTSGASAQPTSRLTMSDSLQFVQSMSSLR